MRTPARVLLFVLALPTLAIAQTVAGVWRGATPDNGTSIELNLKIDGETLTGTLTYGDESYAINEGTAVKNQIRFKITRRGPDGEVVESIIGDLKGDQLLCYLERQGPGSSLTFTRAK
jgi:NDP-sugar pyrophosphorylase family protein